MLINIPGWLSDREGHLLACFAKKANGPIVEIGSFQGKSTIYMAMATKQKIYAIDPHQGETHENKKSFPKTYESFLNNLKKYKVKNVIPIRKTSQTANKEWQGKIGLLHIDGLHEYKYAKQDLNMWLKFLDNNGVVICHDAFAPYPDVFKAVKEELIDKNFGYVGINDSQIFAIKNNYSFNPQKPFIILASNIWHNEKLPYPLRDFLVKRVLKPFYLNKFIIRGILKRW